MVAYTEVEDVRKVLQEHDTEGSLSSEFIEAAIKGTSKWFNRQTNGHWFDANLDGDIYLRSTAAQSASDVDLDVPSSPHAQDRQLVSSNKDARYPVTTHGPYAQVPLPHLYVTNLTKLEVRDRDGDVTDWVADSDFTEGVGEDFYVKRRGQDSYGRTYLYIRASAIGPRTDFDGLLNLDYDYGLDAQSEAWDDVKRGIAALTAVDLITDDDVLAAIPDNGQLIGVQTQYEQTLKIAFGERGALTPYLGQPIGL